MYFRVKRQRTTIFIEATPSNTVHQLKGKIRHALAGTGEPLKDIRDIRLQLPAASAAGGPAVAGAVAGSASKSVGAGQQPAVGGGGGAALAPTGAVAQGPTAAAGGASGAVAGMLGAVGSVAAVTSFCTLDNAATVEQLGLRDEQILYMTCFVCSESSEGKWENVEIAVPDPINPDFDTSVNPEADAAGATPAANLLETPAPTSEKGKERAS